MNIERVKNLKFATICSITTTMKLDGSLPANPVNDRRIANAVTLQVLFVYRKISNYSKISDYGTGGPFGGVPGGWHPQTMSKYLSVKYLLISKKK